MTIEQKKAIVEATAAWMEQHGITAAAIATATGINNSYLSHMLNGKTFLEVSGKEVAIADKYYQTLAEHIGLSLKKSVWEHVVTREFAQIMHILEDAKASQECRTLVCDSGAGKTYAVNRFQKAHPNHTYVLTMNSLVSIHDILKELTLKLGLADAGSKVEKQVNLLRKLREIKKSGGNPIIIIDESENMNGQAMKMLKGLYDGLEGYVAIVLVGTEQLWKLMEKAKLKDAQSGPQFYRRFKPGTRHIRVNDNKLVRFAPFFDALGIADKGFQRLLCNMCDNYGELHSYLMPVLRAAQVNGMPVTVELFKTINNITE